VPAKQNEDKKHGVVRVIHICRVLLFWSLTIHQMSTIL